MACRMFGYCGSSESDVQELYAGLTRACANDPNLGAVAPGCSAHCHGWGYVINADNGLFHYRTAKSIYEDKIVLPKLEGKIRTIFHGRYASKPELAGHIFAHPFMAADSQRVTFFAHNGGVNAPGLPERKVDSEWAMEEVIAAGGLAQALPKLKEHTGSALNLLVLTIDRKKDTPALLEYFHYFKPKEPGKVDYYKMFEGKMPGGRALMSSTLTLPDAKLTSLKEIQPAKFDQLISLES
jgi:predicted glutamine amidotransferase